MTTSDDLKQRIEAIETGYEFMLAYAAQGRDTDKGAAAGRNVREYLDKMVAALEGLSASSTRAQAASTPICRRRAPRSSRPSTPTRASRSPRFDSCSRARTISSQLIDNLNASIHLRALLTDLFVVDEALKPPKPRS